MVESVKCGVEAASRRLLLLHNGTPLVDNAEGPSLPPTWFDSPEITRSDTGSCSIYAKLMAARAIQASEAGVLVSRKYLSITLP